MSTVARGEDAPLDAALGTHPMDSYCKGRKPRSTEAVLKLAQGYCNNCKAETGRSCKEDFNPATNTYTNTSKFFPAGGTDLNFCMQGIKVAEFAIDRYCALRVPLVTPLSATANTEAEKKSAVKLLTENAQDLKNAAATLRHRQKIAATALRDIGGWTAEALRQAKIHAEKPESKDGNLTKRFARFAVDFDKRYKETFFVLDKRSTHGAEEFENYSKEVLARAVRLNGGEDIQLKPAPGELGDGTVAKTATATGTATETNTGTAATDDEKLTPEEVLRRKKEKDAAIAAATKETLKRGKQLTAAQRLAFERAVAELGGDTEAARKVAANFKEISPKLDSALKELERERLQIYRDYPDHKMSGTTEAEIRTRLIQRAKELGIPGMMKQFYMVDANGQINPAAAVLATDKLFGDGKNFPAYAPDAKTFIENALVRGSLKDASFTGSFDAPTFTDAGLGGTIRDGFGEVRQNFVTKLAELEAMDAEVEKTLTHNLMSYDARIALAKGERSFTDAAGVKHDIDPTNLTKFVPEDMNALLKKASFDNAEAAIMVATNDPKHAPLITSALKEAAADKKFNENLLIGGEIGLGVGSLLVGGPIGKGIMKGLGFAGRRLGVGALLTSNATRAQRFFSLAGPMLTKTGIGVMGLSSDALAVKGYFDALDTFDDAQMKLMMNPNAKGFELLRASYNNAQDKKLWAAVAGVSGATAINNAGATLARGSLRSLDEYRYTPTNLNRDIASFTPTNIGTATTKVNAVPTNVKFAPVAGKDNQYIVTTSKGEFTVIQGTDSFGRSEFKIVNAPDGTEGRLQYNLIEKPDGTKEIQFYRVEAMKDMPGSGFALKEALLRRYPDAIVRPSELAEVNDVRIFTSLGKSLVPDIADLQRHVPAFRHTGYNYEISTKGSSFYVKMYPNGGAPSTVAVSDPTAYVDLLRQEVNMTDAEAANLVKRLIGH